MGEAQRRIIVMSPASLVQPLWSQRRRTIFIIASATSLWALPAALAYGIARLF